jgi:hypothetical protein
MTHSHHTFGRVTQQEVDADIASINARFQSRYDAIARDVFDTVERGMTASRRASDGGVVLAPNNNVGGAWGRQGQARQLGPGHGAEGSSGSPAAAHLTMHNAVVVTASARRVSAAPRVGVGGSRSCSPRTARLSKGTSTGLGGSARASVASSTAIAPEGASVGPSTARPTTGSTTGRGTRRETSIAARVRAAPPFRKVPHL